MERDGVTNVHVLAADVTDEAALRDAASETREILQGKGLDVLINNAGYISEISHLKGLDELWVSPFSTLDIAQSLMRLHL